MAERQEEEFSDRRADKNDPNKRQRIGRVMELTKKRRRRCNLHAGGDESVESEDGELYRLEIKNGKKVFTKFSS